MKLYEVKASTSWQSHLAGNPGRQVRYMTSKQEATKVFNQLVKAMPCDQVLMGRPDTFQQVELNQVELKTNLVAVEWIMLLESDSPGDRCELTPVDLIQDRKTIKRWVNGGDT